MKIEQTWASILSMALAAGVAVPSPAAPPANHTEEGCTAFTWDLSRELAAMKTPADLLAASVDKKVNPVRLAEGRRYAATLVPQGSVKFAMPPARPARSSNPTAGLLFFRTGAAGPYRISLSSRHWIDVLDGGKPVDSRSHQGRDGCEQLRKVVEFELPANRELVLQLSGDNAATVDVVVTAGAKP